MDNLFYQLVIALSTIFIAFILFLLFRHKPKQLHVILTIFSVIFLVNIFFGYFLPDGFITVINGSALGGIFYDRTDIFHSILRWGLNISTVVVPISVFCKNRLMKNIAIYVCLPFSILSLVFFGNFIRYFTDTSGRAIAMSSHISEKFRLFIFNRTFRSIYFSIQLLFALIIPLSHFFISKHRFNIKDPNERKNFFVSLPFVILAMMPVYIPQSFFGFGPGPEMGSYGLVHMLWLTAMILEIVVCYKVFRDKDYQTRYELCFFLSLQLFMHYNSTYIMSYEITKLPLQLCNLGSYICLLIILTKSKNLFYFCYIANVVGATIAVVLPDTDDGYFSFWYVHFVMEHMQVFAIPIIMGLLKLFPRMQKRHLKVVWIGFSIYFFFCLILGTIFNGIALKTGDMTFDVNYFYIFDLEKMFKYIPFIGLLGRKVMIFKYYTLYPIFQSSVYILYMVLCIICFFVIERLYVLAEDHRKLRQVRIQLVNKWKQRHQQKINEHVEG